MFSSQDNDRDSSHAKEMQEFIEMCMTHINNVVKIKAEVQNADTGKRETINPIQFGTSMMEARPAFVDVIGKYQGQVSLTGRLFSDPSFKGKDEYFPYGSKAVPDRKVEGPDAFFAKFPQFYEMIKVAKDRWQRDGANEKNFNGLITMVVEPLAKSPEFNKLLEQMAGGDALKKDVYRDYILGALGYKMLGYCLHLINQERVIPKDATPQQLRAMQQADNNVTAVMKESTLHYDYRKHTDSDLRYKPGELEMKEAALAERHAHREETSFYLRSKDTRSQVNMADAWKGGKITGEEIAQNQRKLAAKKDTKPAVAPASSLRREEPTQKKASTSDQTEYGPKVKEKLAKTSGTKGIFGTLKVNKAEREAALKAEQEAQRRIQESEARVKAQLELQEAKKKGLAGAMPEDPKPSPRSGGK